VVTSQAGVKSYVAPTLANSNVDLAVPGVYVDTYVARDNDNNLSAEKTRVVVVNDGTYHVGSKHIVRAVDYDIERVAVTGTDAEIVALSGARAWNGTTGAELAPVVYSTGGYRAEVGNYNIIVRVAGDDGTVIAQRNITAEVSGQVFTVTFDGNGSIAQPAPRYMIVAEPDTHIPYTPWGPLREGYTFLGWNTAANGSGVQFTDAYTVRSDMTVYAQWALVPVPETPATPPTVIVTPPPTIINNIVDRVVETVREIVPIASEEPTTIPDPTPPTTSITPPAQWSLLNLLFALFGLALVFITVIFMTRKKNQEEEDTSNQSSNEQRAKKQFSHNLWFFVTLAFALTGLLLFAFTSPSLDNRMILSDRWTLIHGIIFVATFVASILTFRRKKEDDPKDDDLEPALV
jgi:uncharacterized repeat protein (TIGR02543 family)